MLGTLSRLPDELLLMILEEADFQTLLRFSQVSRHAMDVVAGLKVCRDMAKRCPEILTMLAARTSGSLKTSLGAIPRPIYTRPFNYDRAAKAVVSNLEQSYCTFCGVNFAPYLHSIDEQYTPRIWAGDTFRLFCIRRCRTCLVNWNTNLPPDLHDISRWEQFAKFGGTMDMVLYYVARPLQPASYSKSM